MERAKETVDFLGYETAAELKGFVTAKNGIYDGEIALVKDLAIRDSNLYLIHRKNKRETLYLILPGCKELCEAKVRKLRRDVSYIFEVLA